MRWLGKPSTRQTRTPTSLGSTDSRRSPKPGMVARRSKREGDHVIEPQRRLQPGVRREIGGLIFDVAISCGKNAATRSHRSPGGLLNRSARFRFFSSQYSGVTTIDSPESSPSSNKAPIRSSALRPWSDRITLRTYSAHDAVTSLAHPRLDERLHRLRQRDVHGFHDRILPKIAINHPQTIDGYFYHFHFNLMRASTSTNRRPSRLLAALLRLF